MSEFEKIYFDPKHPASFSGSTGLLNSFKSKKKKEAALNWLRSQDIFSLHIPTRKRFPRRHYRLSTIFELFEADLSDVHQLKDQNKGVTFLLFVIDAVSKYLWVEPLKNKKPESIVQALKKIFKKCEPHLPFRIMTDSGLEFRGKKTQEYLKSLGIKFCVARNPILKCSHAERVQRSIKERLQRYLEYKNTKKYIDVLQDIVSSYNERIHSATLMKPSSVTFENVNIAVANIRKKYRDPPVKKPKYKVGDTVRISRERGLFEKKFTAGFSEELFKISRVDTSQTPHIYELKDLNGEDILGSFYHHELSKVTKNVDDSEYIVERVLERRGTGRKAEVLVKWAGYPKSFNSWIPLSQLRNVAEG